MLFYMFFVGFEVQYRIVKRRVSHEDGYHNFPSTVS